MKVTSTLQDNSALFAERLREGSRRATIAMAFAYLNTVKRGLRGGYTSGDFVKGIVINSVTALEPFWDVDGWATRVGTNLNYALFWELGHHNIFTRKYERVRVWIPALEVSRMEMYEVYNRVLIRYLEHGG